jgi:predicted transcriptional regulator
MRYKRNHGANVMDIEQFNPILTAEIVGSYVRHHKVRPEQLPEIIASVRQTLSQLGQPVQPEEVLTPAVSVRRSVSQDHVTCLDCGYRGKTLRRHITARHGLSRDEYLKRWRLKGDHPLTAPAYSERRSILAKELGLGRKATAEVAASATPTAPVSANADPKSEVKPAPRRSSRSASKSDVVSESAATPTPARQRRPRSKSNPATA